MKWNYIILFISISISALSLILYILFDFPFLFLLLLFPPIYLFNRSKERDFSIPESLHCKYCGKIFQQKEYKFCPYCGKEQNLAD